MKVGDILKHVKSGKLMIIDLIENNEVFGRPVKYGVAYLPGFRVIESELLKAIEDGDFIIVDTPEDGECVSSQNNLE